MWGYDKGLPLCKMLERRPYSLVSAGLCQSTS